MNKRNIENIVKIIIEMDKYIEFLKNCENMNCEKHLEAYCDFLEKQIVELENEL